ncbi:MAG: HEAT repeat domain-containing protein [Planctomycetota bacterium]
MPHHLFTALLLSCALLGSCATTRPEPDPEIERERQEKRDRTKALAEQMTRINAVLLNLDKAMDKYVEAVARGGYQRADEMARGLENYLRGTSTKHFEALVEVAVTDTDSVNRARAVGALGFSDRPEALDPLLNGLRSGHPAVVTNAAFGLGILSDARTPPQALGAIIENGALPQRTRIGAAWSLLRVQAAMHDPAEAVPIWQRLLVDPDANVDAWILVQALRGVGRSRVPANAAAVIPFLDHPTPLVRQAAAIASGYLGSVDAVDGLLARIGPEETNANVRLSSRKALKALAGGTDRGYDVMQWRRLFDDAGR